MTKSDWQQRGASRATDAAMYRALAKETQARVADLPDSHTDREYGEVLADKYNELADLATYYSDRAWTAARTAA